MAINSLKDLKEINGKPIKHIVDGCMVRGDWNKDSIADEKLVIDHDYDHISFNMLTKPASEGGDLNRCQWSDLVATGLEMLKYQNDRFPCRENSLTITKLEEALMWNYQRTKNRQARGVEGKDEP